MIKDFNEIDPNKIYHPLPGVFIKTAIEDAINVAKHFEKEIVFEFNKEQVNITPFNTYDEVYDTWYKKFRSR